ncbi:MAG: spore coat associated protein CotJA [Lachnospiraceae bacterium]|nr:spore coat associated protein CotJA [Lachnospiraceae bacterium]
MDCYCNRADTCNTSEPPRHSRMYRQTMNMNMSANRSSCGVTNKSNQNHFCPAAGNSHSSCQDTRMQNQQRRNAPASAGRPCCPETRSDSEDCFQLMHALRATDAMPVGMAYIPYQEFGCLYERNQAFCRGTLFPDLDQPFLVTACVQGGARL